MEEFYDMEINIYEKQNAVFFSVSEDKDEYLMNFDNLVKLAKKAILSKEEKSIKINAEKELALYKSTIDTILQDILKDEELLTLLKENDGLKMTPIENE